MTGYLHREISSRVHEALRDMPVVVLTGLRQCGKSTFLRNDPVLKKRRYLSLDRFGDHEAIRTNAEAILGEPGAITIDEAQRLPGIMEIIKAQVDREGQIPGRFLLSGSANFSLLKGVSESLAGRAIYIEMSPFSRREILRATTKEPFLRAFFKKPSLPREAVPPKPISPAEILRGGMPRVALGGVRNPSTWFTGYEQTYVERDVRQLSQVADLISFRRAVRLSALRTGKILKISELARDAQLPVATLSRYLGVMETSCLVRRLPPYLDNPVSRVVKSSKLFFNDAGLAAHLAGIRDISPVADALMRGPLVETYFLQNLTEILSARWPEAGLHYWNVQGRHEVDFVIADGSDSLAIEVKASTRWSDSDLAGLRAFLAGTPRCRAGILAYGGRDSIALGDRLFALPIALVLG
jgi:predicted AAA+ superfamily ATPase